jgi:hypothetical protein
MRSKATREASRSRERTVSERLENEVSRCMSAACMKRISRLGWSACGASAPKLDAAGGRGPGLDGRHPFSTGVNKVLEGTTDRFYL